MLEQEDDSRLSSAVQYSQARWFDNIVADTGAHLVVLWIWLLSIRKVGYLKQLIWDNMEKERKTTTELLSYIINYVCFYQKPPHSIPCDSCLSWMPVASRVRLYYLSREIIFCRCRVSTILFRCSSLNESKSVTALLVSAVGRHGKTLLAGESKSFARKKFRFVSLAALMFFPGDIVERRSESIEIAFSVIRLQTRAQYPNSVG